MSVVSVPAVRGGGQPSGARAVAAGAPAGIAAGLVYGAAMAQLGLLPTVATLVGLGSSRAGFAVHLAISAVVGAGFGLMVRRQRCSPGERVVLGAAYGALWGVMVALLWPGLDPGMRGPVTVYSLLLTAMAAGAYGLGRIAALGSDLAIATSDNPRTEDPGAIIDDIERGMDAVPHRRMVDRLEAIHLALAEGRPGDTILLAGKGHETYQVLGTEKVPFDERAIVRAATGEPA